ncbi:MAG: GH32 C-terminal domain-containing protein [Muribaculaceae bacterium]|nr:GH32 C-terminal domain-containing protein [Muribaculaceae bacterium]
MKHLLTTALLAAAMQIAGAQQPAAHFPMTLSADGKIEETSTHATFTVASHLPACDVDGLDGKALRFDGNSNYVKATVPVAQFNTEALTVSVTLAPETYPMMVLDVAETTPTFATVCGNLNGKTGFSLELSSHGDLKFNFGSAYAGGFLFSVSGTEKLPRGKWSVVTAVLNKAGNAATLYLNGKSIGTARMNRAAVVHGPAEFYIGKGADDAKSGPFLLNTFCGLIDDIAVYNKAFTADEVAALVPSTLPAPDFNFPASRYASSLWRPAFHGMPSGNWTNECHGMTYSDGRFHVFFQKNACGPYMSRLNWGHITSENLYLWREEPIAFGPDQSYDIKGCWSGCVFDMGGTPEILYTAVDNARATIVHATPADASLLDWNKQGIVINGRPAGLSDDFRDPYYFTAGGKRYIIVGTSKNNVGACTLHRWENGAWTNDGTIFFQGATASQHGTFWEMPNVTDMGGGKWLFTCTPLGTSVGVRTLCWTGTIGDDGKFVPDGTGVQYLEMGGVSRDGYGLLSPTIYRHNGKTLLLGIVPDKLPGSVNYDMGWAHNYSLPREISLDDGGKLVQKPYSGLTGMRTSTTFSRSLTLNGTQSLAPVSGRQIELLGTFTVPASGKVGFNFLQSGADKATLGYDAATGMLTLDASALSRRANDGGSYGGVYSAALPVKPATGSALKLHLFLDGSIVDIFVNDTWAFSVRVFPTEASGTGAEAFSTVATAATLKAWTLDPTLEGGGTTDPMDVNSDGNVDVGDVNTVLSDILTTGGKTLAYDVNSDGNVDVGDVNAILAAILSR